MDANHGFQYPLFMRLQLIPIPIANFQFHKLASIKLFDKNPDDATISIFFNKFVAALREQEYESRMTEALYERTFLMLLSSLINPVANLHRNIKSCDRVENKGVGFTAQ